MNWVVAMLFANCKLNNEPCVAKLLVINQNSNITKRDNRYTNKSCDGITEIAELQKQLLN